MMHWIAKHAGVARQAEQVRGQSAELVDKSCHSTLLLLVKQKLLSEQVSGRHGQAHLSCVA
jgi:hypothetical protein